MDTKLLFIINEFLNRLPPKNGFTGSPQELITEGGELTFCRKIIKESKQYKDNVV